METGEMKTILVVEDNERNMKLAVDLLGLARFEILKAVDGETAWEILKTHRPDLILLDLGLPGMSGYELYVKIRGDQKLNSIKVAAFTASVMKHEKEIVLAAGLDAFITKPIDTTSFIKEIQGLLGV